MIKRTYRPEVKPIVLEETYEVERVVAKRIRSRKVEYFIKWQGYCSSVNTWEPREHLPGEIIIAFEDRCVIPLRVDEAIERLALLFESGLKSFNSEYDETLTMRHDVLRTHSHLTGTIAVT